MADLSATFLVTIGAIGGWFFSKTADAIFESFVNGIGKVEFLPTWCAFTCNADHPERGVIRTQYDPRKTLADATFHRILIEGDFINHRKTSVILSKPVLWFEHPNRDPFTFSNPAMTVAGMPGVVIAIPAQTAMRIQLSIDVPKDMISEFESALPVLELALASGARKRFRLTSGSFLGPTFAVWPRRGKRPVQIGGCV